MMGQIPPSFFKTRNCTDYKHSCFADLWLARFTVATSEDTEALGGHK